MPRQVRTNIDTRQVLTPISRPKTTEVVARPTDQLEVPAVDPEMMGLISGLSALSPSLQQYAYASRYSQQKENAGHMQAGAADAAQGKELKPGSPEYKVHGYMVQKGQIAAEQEAQVFLNKVNTEFDKDTGNYEEFTAKHFANAFKGVNDQSYMEGVHQVLPKHLDQIRQGVLKHRSDALVAHTETDFMTRMNGAFRAYTDNGMPIPVEAVDAFRKEGKDFFGITGSRFNDLRFNAIKSMGDEGNYAALETLKQKNVDGTPSMYDIPEWKPKIDAAVYHAKSVSLQKDKERDVANKKVRDDNQNKALFDVFLKADTDPEGAQQDYNNLRKSGLFTRADELVEWDAKFATVAKREASAGQQQVELDLQQGIYTGSTRPAHIMKASLTPPQKRSLMGEWGREQSANATRASNGQKAEDSIYKTSHFDSGKDYLRTVLRPQASPLDPMGIGTEFARVQMATAEREYVEAARKVKDPTELYGISQEIADRYMTRNKDPRIQKELTNAGNLRYSTLEELKEADRKGFITDPIEFQNQLRYFKSLGPTANAR